MAESSSAGLESFGDVLKKIITGTKDRLECEVCESPRDLFLDTKWYFTSDYNMDHIKEIKETSTLSIKNDSLHIYNIGETQGGLYVCQKGNHSARPYIVHVFMSEPTKRVVPQNSSEGDHAAPDALIPELGLRVTTQWEEWTQCSRCDQIGKRYRTGICTVLLNRSQTESRTKRKTFSSLVSTQTVFKNFLATEITSKPDLLQSANSTAAAAFNDSRAENLTTVPMENLILLTENLATTTEDKAQNGSLEDDLSILNIFEDGIPCRSKLLSGHIQNLDVVSKRSSEVMFAYCKMRCPKDIVFVVVDEKGDILETANNSDGVYSVLQGIPKDIPSVTRTLEYAIYKKFFKIECPGKRSGDIPVEWYVGRKALTNKLLKKETDGRVTIDEYNRINFNPVLFKDGRVFSCWQRKELVGTVRLVVEKEHDLKYQKPIVFIGTFVIFALFLKIYYRAFTLA